MTKDKFKTKHDVFDEHTNRVIYKLITQGHFRGLESPIFIGKESNVFSALTNDGRKVIVKIYRLETCDFNRMYDYIKADPRFINLQKKRRQIIFAWVQREYRNLFKAREGNVKVPIPIAFSKNVLVEEFIGKKEAARMLKDAIPKNKKDFFNKIIENMKNLYKAKMVHADLSAFNILNYDEVPYFIDMSQTTTLENARAEEFLKRDVRNICIFFNKIGLKVNEDKTIKKIKQ